MSMFDAEYDSLEDGISERTLPQFRVHETQDWQIVFGGDGWWPGTESNRRHADFQSAALPTELPGRR